MRWIQIPILLMFVTSVGGASPPSPPAGVTLAGGSAPEAAASSVAPIPAHDYSRAHVSGGAVEPVGLENEANDTVVVSEEDIKSEITSLQNAVGSAADLTDEVNSECVARIDKAKQWLQKARQSIADRQHAKQELESTPKRTESVRQQLSGAVELPTPEIPAGATVALMETKLGEIRQKVEAAEADAVKRQAETESRAARMNQLSKEIQDAESRIEEARDALQNTGDEDLTSRSNRLEQRARLLALQEQLLTLKAQRGLLEATAELMPLERDLAVRTASAMKKQMQRWEEVVSNWRKDESKRQAEQARRVVEKSHPAIRSIAIQNAEIAELRITSADGIANIAKWLGNIDTRASELAEEFEELRGKVEHAGATTSTGILLRKQRSELPGFALFAERAAMVAKQMPIAHLQLMELKQLRREVADVDEAVDEQMKQLQGALTRFNQAEVRDVLTRLMSNRRKLLDKAIPDQDTYLQDLNELELANRKFEQQVAEMREFLDQRVLWMRSNDSLTAQDIRHAASGLATLLQPSRWIEVCKVCVGDLVRRPAAGLSVLTLLVMAIMFRANLLAKQRRLTELPGWGEPIRFSRYLASFALTFVVSIRWPLLLATIGYRAQYSADATEWTKAVGVALFTTILFVWGLELIREFSSRDGVGERLFGWRSEVTASLRGSVDTTFLVGTPLFAILQLSLWQESSSMENLQRVVFIAILLLVGFQIAWLVRPSGQLMNKLQEQSPHALAYRLRRPIWILCSAAPLAFAGMSVVGYHFSAYQLSGRLAESAAAIVAVIVLYSLALSWVKSKAYNREVRQYLEKANESASAESEDANDVDLNNQREITAVASQETQDLLRYTAIIGLFCTAWIIWSGVLPALRVLDQVELWQNLQTVSETIVDADGVESVTTFEKTVPTTLTNLLAAISICFATFVVGKRLPSLLALTVLDRLPLDLGGRQAIAILVRYMATLTGLLLACHAIKLSWESVQWLAAAMTVGLGFGLQEIFANLVSGLIILFERPIRAGDLVTVDDVTGHVSRMQIRATTITDFDRREFIVPNKRFITDNVINWTLSDPISRVILPVGVAYGTDVERVHEILLRIAKYERIVMNEPAPVSLFKGFGDSTLDFELRVFIPQREFMIDVTNRINGAIAKEFKKADIEIAFPQLDLHVKREESENASADAGSLGPVANDAGVVKIPSAGRMKMESENAPELDEANLRVNPRRVDRRHKAPTQSPRRQFEGQSVSGSAG